MHILRGAEKYAIRNGGNDLSCYCRLLRVPVPGKGRASDSRSVQECHKFQGTLEGASPSLFTFLRYLGMPPHNDAAELEIRDVVVLHRNVRHKLSEAEVFSVLVSVAPTCYKQEMFPRVAVEERAKDPGWSILRPPERERKEAVILAAASC